MVLGVAVPAVAVAGSARADISASAFVVGIAVTERDDVIVDTFTPEGLPHQEPVGAYVIAHPDGTLTCGADGGPFGDDGTYDPTFEDPQTCPLLPSGPDAQSREGDR
jgi:hypothetical protein